MKPLRSPSLVMRLARMGAAHQSRLSFMRVLLRRLRQENWTFDRPIWQIDENGVGHAVYRAIGPRRTYSLVAFAHDLPDDQRTDRVIAEAWDTTFALVDGTPTQADIARLADNVPKQEAGRVSDKELVLSRANRSTRLWDHVVGALAAGHQPDTARIADVGYLMRTTAVYGSGKFGAADHGALRDRAVMGGPFRAEMLTVWLIRTFCLDLVEDRARTLGGAGAATLDPAVRRQFGIGNSTGLGMAPFLVNHPLLLNAWMTARETAFARVRSRPKATQDEIATVVHAFMRFRRVLDAWVSDDPVQQDRLNTLKEDCEKIARLLSGLSAQTDDPWEYLYKQAERDLSIEGQELVLTLMLEPFASIVDDLAGDMNADEASSFQIDGSWTLGDLHQAIDDQYSWAMTCDYRDPDRKARFWYTSEAKLEPRLGERFDEPGAELEQPLDIARQVSALADDIGLRADDMRLSEFLTDAPEHRRIVRRIQIAAQAPYAEIQDNLIDADLRPIDMLRCKLAFFGATRFDPRSDRWVRITMFQNAPFPHELAELPEDAWIYDAYRADPRPNVAP